MSIIKRVKLAKSGKDDSSDYSQLSGSSDGENGRSPGQESLWDTDDEIAGGQCTKSKKTLKRKRRATEPSHFGATLQSLLNTDAPSGLPLSLKPSVTHQKNEAKLELEAKKAIQIERKEKEERGRIRDVIGGWGGESERCLRKVAQRGVVKLFNTIQQSQVAAVEAKAETKASRGTEKPSLPTSSLGTRKKNVHKKNGPGMEKHSTADKDIFFDMIRSGGIVSKA